MPDSIVDGQGSGYKAGVSKENRLLVGGVSVSKEHHTNFAHQDSYNMLFDVTPTGAGDRFLYIKNTDIDPIVCEGFSIQSPSDEIITVNLGGVGTPAGGTDVVPANLSAGNSKTARGTFQTGVDITGITSEVTVAKYAIAGSTENKFRNFDADIVIPQNQTLCLIAENGAIALSGFIVMWHDHGGV
jgi:hypothetical protein